MVKAHVDTQAPCSLSFSGSGSRSGSSFKMNNFWTIKPLFVQENFICVYIDIGKCCFRPKKHKTKVHVGEN